MDALKLRMAFERDSYNDSDKVYLEKESGNIFWIPENIGEYGPASEKELREILLKINTYPERYVEIPMIDHAEWHRVFRKWLAEIGKEGMYTTSIGLTLKELDDQELRFEWGDYKFAYAEKKAEEFEKNMQSKKG
jgi:hypothetical protein